MFLSGSGPTASVNISCSKQQQKAAEPDCRLKSHILSIFIYTRMSQGPAMCRCCLFSRVHLITAGKRNKRDKKGAHRINLSSPVQSKMADISLLVSEDAGMPLSADL